jgi:predicted deacylase
MQYEVLPLLQPSPGTQRSLCVYRFSSNRPGLNIYLQAGLHADEWPGLLVLQHLLQRLETIEKEDGINGQIVIVPYANPIGLGQNLFGYVTGRFDMTGTGNFNRNFLDPYRDVREKVGGKLGDDAEANQHLIRKALNEAIAAWRAEDEVTALKKTLLQLSTGADVVLDLHCDDRTAAHLYAVKNQAEEAEMLASCLGFRYVFLEDLDGIVAFDGSHLQVWHRLQKDFPDRPIGMPVFAATVEYRGQVDVEDGLAIDDAERLLGYFKQLGSLPSLVHSTARLQNIIVSPLECVDAVKSPATGLVVFCRQLGAMVKAGEVFAEIVILDSPIPNQRIPVRASAEGYLMGLSHRRLVRPGDLIAKIAGQNALSHRRPGNLLQL